MKRIKNKTMDARLARIYRPGMKSEEVSLPARHGSILLHSDTIPEYTLPALPAIYEMMRRIVPFATIILTPSLYETMSEKAHQPPDHYEFEGELFKAWGGLAMKAEPTIYVGIGYSPIHVAAVAAHEAWHCLEYNVLPSHWIDLIDSMIPQNKFVADHIYYSAREELRARAFEAWCMRLVAGLPPQLHPTPIDTIFAKAWSGELAEEAIQYRQEVGRKAA